MWAVPITEKPEKQTKTRKSSSQITRTLHHKEPNKQRKICHTVMCIHDINMSPGSSVAEKKFPPMTANFKVNLERVKVKQLFRSEIT